MAASPAATVPGFRTNRQYYPWGREEGHGRHALMFWEKGFVVLKDGALAAAAAVFESP
jgi:hypothetical protein